MNALLIMTAGQTDVQMRMGNERVDLDKDCCATLHEQVAQRTDWSLVDANVPKGTKKIKELPNTAFELCTPKLDAVLTYAQEGGVQIGNVLVFETRRDSDKERGDPGHVGTVLARRLRETLGLVADVVSYLSGAERLEDRSEPRDAVVRREVVSRIETACRKALGNAKPDSIIVAATGGFPTVASLVEEIVRLHAGTTKVTLLDIPDASRTGGAPVDRTVLRMQVPSPQASFEGRRHALELVRDGHLLGAWSAVRYLHHDLEERRWTRAIEWLYLWASSMPLPDSCDIDLLKHPRMAARAALQVEFALRSGDIPRAIHVTVAFFESALWDHLLERLRPHPTKRRRFSANPTPDTGLIRETQLTEDENRKRPFELETIAGEGGPWYLVYDDDVCATRLAKRYLQKPKLESLAKAISTVRELRNDVAHNVPTPERMAVAREEMQKANLWSSDDRFLCQPLVSEALEELGVSDPRRLSVDLLQLIERRLLDHTLAARTP